MELKLVLTRIAERWNYKLNEVSEGVFSLDVVLKLKDGSNRFQFVFVRVEKPEGGQERYYITSTSGVFNNSLNFYNLLRETSYCNYSTITVGSRKNRDTGAAEEVIMVQAAPLAAHTNYDLLDAIIFEVANNADFIEQKYFGQDKM
jgi:hypothetical protein